LERLLGLGAIRGVSESGGKLLLKTRTTVKRAGHDKSVKV
jgi:hypothetical protein